MFRDISQGRFQKARELGLRDSAAGHGHLPKEHSSGLPTVLAGVSLPLSTSTHTSTLSNRTLEISRSTATIRYAQALPRLSTRMKQALARLDFTSC
jgi:hypothetical protein